MELVLNTFGTALRVENGIFLVNHKDGKQSIDPKKVKSILISKGASISSDAALLAIENEIDVLFVEKGGKPAGRLWSIQFGSVSTIRRKQLDFLYSGKAVDWVKEVVIHKIDNQAGLLLTMDDDDLKLKNIISKTLSKLNDYKSKIQAAEGLMVPDVAPSLRGWEGAASKAYFYTVSELLPVEYRFEKRSQRPALDVFNCLLNYGYGILYGKVEGALIRAGIDPYAGIYHRDDYNRPALVFDVIEVFRVWVDYVVFALCTQKAIDEDCYSINHDGSYWLENMGKRILIQSVNDYLDEVVIIKGRERSRKTHIDLYAQDLAQRFLKS
jgi:CRISP-associated protein Cas1